MRDLLYFHSHDVVGFVIAEDEEVTVVDKFAMVS